MAIDNHRKAPFEEIRGGFFIKKGDYHETKPTPDDLPW